MNGKPYNPNAQCIRYWQTSENENWELIFHEITYDVGCNALTFTLEQQYQRKMGVRMHVCTDGVCVWNVKLKLLYNFCKTFHWVSVTLKEHTERKQDWSKKNERKKKSLWRIKNFRFVVLFSSIYVKRQLNGFIC